MLLRSSGKEHGREKTREHGKGREAEKKQVCDGLPNTTQIRGEGRGGHEEEVFVRPLPEGEGEEGGAALPQGGSGDLVA